MASGNSRGKNLGRLQEFHNMQTYRYRDNEKYAGALKKDKHVLAYDRDNEWKLAKILEVRYFVPYDEDAKFYI